MRKATPIVERNEEATRESALDPAEIAAVLEFFKILDQWDREHKQNEKKL